MIEMTPRYVPEMEDKDIKDTARPPGTSELLCMVEEFNI